MRALFYLSMVVLLAAILLPPGCRRMRERVLLTLVRESERPVEIVAGDPPVFRFAATVAKAVAVIDYQDAASPSEHVSFVPPDGSDRYAWAAAVCPGWTADCLEAHAGVELREVRYGEPAPGFQQIEPRDGAPRALQRRRLYGLALFADKLFVLKMFYLDGDGAHVMDGTRFAEAVVANRRDEIRAFLDER